MEVSSRSGGFVVRYLMVSFGYTQPNVFYLKSFYIQVAILSRWSPLWSRFTLAFVTWPPPCCIAVCVSSWPCALVTDTQRGRRTTWAKRARSRYVTRSSPAWPKKSGKSFVFFYIHSFTVYSLRKFFKRVKLQGKIQGTQNLKRWLNTVAICSQPYQKTLGHTPSLKNKKVPGFLNKHYTTHGTNFFISHPNDKAINGCLASGHKCHALDSNPHSADQEHQSLSALNHSTTAQTFQSPPAREKSPYLLVTPSQEKSNIEHE